MQQGLASAVKRQHEITPTEGGKLRIPRGFLTPGFITAATSLGHTYRVTGIEFANPGSHQGYFSALQVPFMLFGADDFAMARPNRGSRYSPMQMLENAADVDRATTETADCIRHHTGDLPGIGRLCSVIGELHDNVRAHADGAGFSMAQLWSYKGQYDVIEFAVVDAGKGFFRECQRRAVPGVTDHVSAIDWCLRKEHSTKDIDHEDFAQQQPEDAMGNPFGQATDVMYRHDGNHHQGLGLDQLMNLVRHYDGELWIASGDTLLSSTPATRAEYEFGSYAAVPHWQGVAIACRLKLSELGKNIEEEPLSDDVQSILDDLTF